MARSPTILPLRSRAWGEAPAWAAPDLLQAFGRRAWGDQAAGCSITQGCWGLLATTKPPVHAIVFDASAISDVDYSVAKTLLRMTPSSPVAACE